MPKSNNSSSSADSIASLSEDESQELKDIFSELDSLKKRQKVGSDNSVSQD